MASRDINQCTILGTVAFVAPIRRVDGCHPLLSIHVLTADGEHANRHFISAWSNLAINMAETIRVGDRVVVEGRLSSANIHHNRTGLTLTRSLINARRVIVVGHDSDFDSSKYQSADEEAA